jgi:hypothetical protein
MRVLRVLRVLRIPGLQKDNVVKVKIAEFLNPEPINVLFFIINTII